MKTCPRRDGTRIEVAADSSKNALLAMRGHDSERARQNRLVLCTDVLLCLMDEQEQNAFSITSNLLLFPKQ